MDPATLGDPMVTRLYPGPAQPLALRGLYLGHELRRCGGNAPFVYSNFIVSLDGRISQPDPDTGLRAVPAAIANPHDWRLFLELAAQADAQLTTSRHLRAVAAGRHGDLLLPDGIHADLLHWRSAQGLAPRPLLAAVTESLALPLDALRRVYPGPLLVLTSAAADPARVGALRAAGVEVAVVGPGPGLSGGALVAALHARGLRRIYSIGGPRVLHALLDARVLDRLYLTHALALVGGKVFDTLVTGAPLAPPFALVLRELYHDPGYGQMFACYERP